MRGTHSCWSVLNSMHYVMSHGLFDEIPKPSQNCLALPRDRPCSHCWDRSEPLYIKGGVGVSVCLSAQYEIMRCQWAMGWCCTRGWRGHSQHSQPRLTRGISPIIWHHAHWYKLGGWGGGKKEEGRAFRVAEYWKMPCYSVLVFFPRRLFWLLSETQLNR